MFGDYLFLPVSGSESSLRFLPLLRHRAPSTVNSPLHPHKLHHLVVAKNQTRSTLRRLNFWLSSSFFVIQLGAERRLFWAAFLIRLGFLIRGPNCFFKCRFDIWLYFVSFVPSNKKSVWKADFKCQMTFRWDYLCPQWSQLAMCPHFAPDH